MFAAFRTSAYVPFSIAFVVMIGIDLIEAVGLGLATLASMPMRVSAGR